MLYLLNPTSLAKPLAVQQLGTDLIAYDIDIAVVAETWFKNNMMMMHSLCLATHYFVETALVAEEEVLLYMPAVLGIVSCTNG